MREWVNQAIQKIETDFNRSADTHLIKMDLPATQGIEFYLKDESTHPTGSLKHRLARSLFLYGLCNGWIDVWLYCWCGPQSLAHQPSASANP